MPKFIADTMQKFIVVIFLIGVTVAIPPPDGASDECKLAKEREQCFAVFLEAMAPQYNGMKASFQHYCRKMPAIVPCLLENEADYEAMSNCPEDELFLEDQMILSAFIHLFDHLKTWREMFNITIGLLDTVNDLVCSRTDEVINLVNCIKNNDDEFQPLLRDCGEEHIDELGFKLGHNPEEIDAAEICSSTYGFTTCMKDGFINMCGTRYSDLLDTTYYAVVEDIIGNGFGCSESTRLEPLLEFARSVRNLYRK